MIAQPRQDFAAEALRCYSEQERAAFLRWHRSAPQVWQAFERVAKNIWARGKRQWGAKAIMEVVRYEEEIQGGKEWKVNNNYTAYYARILLAKHPHMRGFFETRGRE